MNDVPISDLFYWLRRVKVGRACFGRVPDDGAPPAELSPGLRDRHVVV